MQKKEEMITSKAAILTINIKSFSELIKESDTKGIFAYVNSVLEKLIPVTLEYEGIIDKFIGAGFVAYYMNQPEKALSTAFELCGIMNKAKECCVGLCYGNVMIGNIGTAACASKVTISEYTGISEFLQTIASKYHAHVLVTSSYADRIENFADKYNCRMLGYIRIGSLDRVEKIYDVFFGDKEEDVWLKKKTRLMFEEGVRIYIKGMLEIARQYFIEVLKVYREDTAAKEYLYLCDYYMKEENRKFHNIYIECY